MFRKMQIKLTVLFTLILIFILIGTNLAIYLLLNSYNNSQIVLETDRMLNNILSSEWVQDQEEVEEPNTIDGVPEDDDEEDDYKNEDKDEVEDDKDSEDEKDSDDENDSDDEKDSEDEGLINEGVTDKARNKKVLGRTYKKSRSTEIMISNNGDDEIDFPNDKELIIPSTLDAFSFYYIYDKEGNLLKWKNDFDELSEEFFSISEALTVDEKPQIIDIDGIRNLSFLIQKLPIEIDGEVIGFYTVGRDVSIAKQTMDNLLDILLISLIAGAFVSVVIGYYIAGKMMKPIKEAYIRKQRFIADASHELRTPISVVMLSCDTLIEEETLEADFSKKVIKGIKDEAIIMKELVEKLLNLARFDTGTIKLNQEAINLSSIIKSNINSYQYIASQESIDLTSDIDEGLTTTGDKQLLNSLISILIDNAIKYNHKAGKVCVSAKSVYLKKKAMIQIRVQDTGRGIDDIELENIFKRFYRVDKSRNRMVQGYGLGLSIAYEVANIHNGKINVTSEKDVGTTLTVTLPQRIE